MSILDFALEHVRQGRLVFPGAPNTKLPAVKNPYEVASKDEAQIIAWWQENPNYNICLPGGYEIGPGKYIGFIDVDCKKEGKNGFKSMEELDILGLEFPETLAQETPTGGLHLFYYFDFPIGNSAGLLGKGIDTRGFHGYVIGAGSGIDGKGYLFKNREKIVDAPTWLAERCRGLSRAPERRLSIVHGVDEETAERKSVDFLKTLSPATAGERNDRGFKAACRLKDFGLSPERNHSTLLAHWKCEPAIESDEIWSIVNSAYKYGQNSQGVDSPEVMFTPIPPSPPEEKKRHPIDEVNDEYALVVQNGVRIIREIKIDGKDRIDHLSIQAFHDVLANKLITHNEKQVPVSKLWMKSTYRRQYDGIIFEPNYENKRFFNVWKGFNVSDPQPPKIEAINALSFFIEHIRVNVCAGNEEHFNWVIGFFAHMIQFPERKPRVALALRGKKGVGKNVITECVGKLLGSHYLLAANRRYLSGNFNSHLENKILLVLDEAYWSGDKATEGILKDLITGSTQQIERKGHETYTVKNLMRVVIFGNEEWIVPATDDERRFAVFEVGDKRKRDDEFFGVILDGMRDHGADRLLFEYLKAFDLSKVDINHAPDTDALISQKEQTLDPFKAWWLSCLREGEVSGASTEGWPEEISRDQFRSAFTSDAEAQNIRGRLPSPAAIGRMFHTVSPSSATGKLKRDGDLRYHAYVLAPLEKARAEWEHFIGGKIKWNN